jgi:hypothetical protein
VLGVGRDAPGSHQRLQRFVGGRDGSNFSAVSLKKLSEQLARVVIVFHQEHFHALDIRCAGLIPSGAAPSFNSQSLLLCPRRIAPIFGEW